MSLQKETMLKFNCSQSLLSTSKGLLGYLGLNKSESITNYEILSPRYESKIIELYKYEKKDSLALKKFYRLTQTANSQGSYLDSTFYTSNEFNKHSLLNVLANTLSKRDNSKNKYLTKKIVSELESYYIDSSTIDLNEAIDVIKGIQVNNFQLFEYFAFDSSECVVCIGVDTNDLFLKLAIRRATKVLQRLVTRIVKYCSLIYNQSPLKIFSYEYIDIKNSHLYEKLIYFFNCQFLNCNFLTNNYRDEQRIAKYIVLSC